MSEVIFPIVGLLIVLLFVLPACALLARLLLTVLESERVGGPLRLVNVRYAVLTGSSILPLVWCISAGIHQAESGAPGLACLLDHAGAALCLDSALFALLLTLGVTLAWYRLQRSLNAIVVSTSPRALAVAARLERLFETRPELDYLTGRIQLTESAGFTLATHGIFASTVIVGVAFAETLSDELLAGAFGHEKQHLRAHDPLRYLILELALSVNPFGRSLLSRHASCWKVAREAQCDRAAVVEGAQPLALAEAIVRAARPMSHLVAAMSNHGAEALKLRVGLLVAFSEVKPQPHVAHVRSPLEAPVLLFALALFLPHQTSTVASHVVHSQAEHVTAALWQGTAAVSTE